MDIQRIAGQIARAARHMGCLVTENFSSTSESAYLTIEHEASRINCKVRISTHVLPPSYHALNGSAWFEVGTSFSARTLYVHHHPDTDGDWIDCLSRLALFIGSRLPSRIASPLPPAVKAAKARRDSSTLPLKPGGRLKKKSRRGST
jgi:hypothetical protein